MNETKTPLKVFLCHASIDKSQVRKLYHYLKRRGIRPWFAEEDLVLGANWEEEIQREIGASDLIIICLTKNSINKEGYFQKEIKFASDRAKEMPDGQIFIIPVKLEDCEIPRDLMHYHYWDLSAEKDYAKLLKSLELRALQLGRTPVKSSSTRPKEDKLSEKSSTPKERVLEAAIQNQVFVGRPASLFVWVRRRGSENIISVVKSIDQDVRLDEENVQANELEIVFPVKGGQTLDAELTLRLEAPEFELSSKEKKISVPPNGDSKVCRFVVTPGRTGELLLNLEVLSAEINVGGTAVRTTAIDKEGKIDNPVVLMVIPIFVLVQSPPALPDMKAMGQKDSISKKKDLEPENQKPPTRDVPWAAILGFLGVVLTAYLSFLGMRSQIELPIKATQTAEAKIPTRTAQVISYTDTPQPTVTSILTPTFTPSQSVCPYQGQTDDETIVNLIKAEADAVKAEDIDIIKEIFAPDANFYNYVSKSHWSNPDAYYSFDLFPTTNFKELEHFDILPADPATVGGTVYYTSGSRGRYQIGTGPLLNLDNGSSRTTEYGSDHWVLRKNDKGCWVIIKLEFNAGHVEFP